MKETPLPAGWPVPRIQPLHRRLEAADHTFGSATRRIHAPERRPPAYKRYRGSLRLPSLWHAGAIGLFLGYVFVKYGIEAAIVLHFTNNVIAAIQEISLDAGFEGMVGLTSFIFTSFTLLGMMKIFSEGLNLMSKFRMRKEKILLKRYQ